MQQGRKPARKTATEMQSSTSNRKSNSMPNETAMLNLAALKAGAFATSKDATRFYLGGVFVEIKAEQIIYVATDGHILFAHRSVRDANTLIGNWIIPAATIKELKYSKHGSPDALLLRATGNQLTIKTQEQSIDFTPIDGTFPDWRKIVPELTKGKMPEELEYDSKLLDRLHKAAKILALGEPSLSPNDGGPGLMTFEDNNAIGLIMPKRPKPAIPAAAGAK